MNDDFTTQMMIELLRNHHFISSLILAWKVMNEFFIKLFNKKVLFSLVFLGFTVFWGLDFVGATLCLIAYPLLQFSILKSNLEDKGGAFKDYRFITQTTLIIGISYFVFMVQYLSIPNTNKLIQTQELQKGSYYIPEYKSARPRPDSALLLKNDKGGQVVVCSLFVCVFYCIKNGLGFKNPTQKLTRFPPLVVQEQTTPPIKAQAPHQ